MGFFSAKATCAICGREVGLNRYRVGKTVDGKDIWKCPECARKGGYVEIDRITGKAKIETLKETEKRAKCNVCGNIYCFNGADLVRNKQNANMAKAAAVGSALAATGGTRLDMYGLSNMADRHTAAIVDYTRCPKCNSMDVYILSDEEYEKEKQRTLSASENDNTFSAADELKKFKELLDSGIITQEEFDAKKKQLLGL